VWVAAQTGPAARHKPEEKSDHGSGNGQHRDHHALRARVSRGRPGDDRRALRPGLVDHTPAPGEEPTLAGFRQKVAGFKAIFPDLEEDLQDIIARGDTVATRWVVTGSQQQEFMGIRASGQPIRVEGMNSYRLKDGRVTDMWTQFDGVALMQQLGAIPA
jgi:predicted ester cyclase